MKKCIITILLIIWMAFIFIMSARDGDASEDISHSVGRFIGSIIVPGFEELDGDAQDRYAESIDLLVRKTAHATEYAILGVLACLCFYYHGISRYGVLGLLLGVLYAISDEIHQIFVPGRSGQVTDVILDSCGVLVGSFICVLVIRGMKTRLYTKYNRGELK